MMQRQEKETCSKPCCPWGWLGKRFLGLSLGLWLIFFALVPHSARGVAWTVRAAAGLWDRSEHVMRGDRAPRFDRLERGDRPDYPRVERIARD